MEIAASGYIVTSGNAKINTTHTRIIGKDFNMFRCSLIKELVFLILTELATKSLPNSRSFLQHECVLTRPIRPVG
jgi:L-lactate permease